jgi:hypothetical protein
MAHNGFLVLDATDPREDKNAELKQSLQLLFVFDITPLDIGQALRVKPTPVNDPDSGDARFNLFILSLLNERIGLVDALDAGEAVYVVANLQVASPIDPQAVIAEAEALWQTMHSNGIAQMAEDRFEHAGTWVAVAPE